MSKHVMAIVSKAVFEKEMRDARVGARYETTLYRSAQKKLDELAGGGTLWLVTVRPGDELWLVGALRNPKKTSDGWAARNEIAICDLSLLRNELFASGARLPSEPGKLGMALQTPRSLSSADVALLESIAKPTVTGQTGAAKSRAKAAEPAGAAGAASTESSLDGAFEVFLGAPLSSFDPNASYGLFAWVDELDAAFEWDGAALKSLAKPLAPAAAKKFDAPSVNDVGFDRYSFDLARSLFGVKEVDDPRVAPALQKDAGEAGVLTGERFAAVMKSLDVDSIELGDFVPVLHRVRSDGTLRDAMAAATWTMSAPHGLIERRAQVHEHWVKSLERISDPSLRNHFGNLCQSEQRARSSGAYFLGKKCPNDLDALVQAGHEVLAAWVFGEGQAATAVVKLAPEKSRPVAVKPPKTSKSANAAADEASVEDARKPGAQATDPKMKGRVAKIAVQLEGLRKQFPLRPDLWWVGARWSEAEVSAFEAKHGIVLPAAYREILLTVGDGGSGLGYFSGWLPLRGQRLDRKIREPFPLKKPTRKPPSIPPAGAILLGAKGGADAYLALVGPETGKTFGSTRLRGRRKSIARGIFLRCWRAAS